ncbi:YafY family protein (plasmid) [Erythrobacteraceae bacterium WH01K]|nr:YafY family protein [Erythrobacteraceae bacterium WH01K]
MRRADRLIQIIQILRRRAMPTTARMLAEELEVAPRTVYRDIVALQAARVPVDGEAGIGYVLRPGYDLPPLMFTAEEIEAVVLGAQLVIGRADPGLAKAAENVLAKIKAVLPGDAEARIRQAGLIVPHALEEGVTFGDHVAQIRQAVRQSCKLAITYTDRSDHQTCRVIWPLGLYLYSHVTLVCAWCEERRDFRAFRSDRITTCRTLDQRFDGGCGKLMQDFLTHFEGRQGTKPNETAV